MATTTPTLNGDALPVYLSFTTFQSAVQSLRIHGLPDKLDRTAWQSRSGTEQGQIIGAFKFLGLIDENDRTEPGLKSLADVREGSEAEKEILSELLKAKYLKLFELDLKTATPGQVAAAVGSYGPTGATRDRAVRFFLKAAHYCGIPMSSRLTAGMRTRLAADSDASAEENAPAAAQPTPARPRRRRRIAVPENTERHDERLSGSAVKTISLRETTGTLTLSGTFNPFDLDGEERKLVYEIIDLMKRYEQKKETASE
jgi:hypothetical protein